MDFDKSRVAREPARDGYFRFHPPRVPEFQTLNHMTIPQMARTKLTNKIRLLLDDVESAKEVKGKLSKLTLIKILVEEDLERLKKERDKERVAYDRKTQILKRALKQFLTALDRIYAKHEELGDTAVRDSMFAAILRSFIKPEKAYMLPARFGMFDEQADILVRAAIQRFLSHPEVAAACRLLKSPEERLNAFQDEEVETSEGTNFFEYFGYRNKPVA